MYIHGLSIQCICFVSCNCLSNIYATHIEYLCEIMNRSIYTIFKRSTALLGGSCLPEAGLRCFVNIYICVKWIVLLVWFLLWGRVLSTVVNASTISIYAESMQVGWRREILKYRLLGKLSKSRQVGRRREILIEKLLAAKLGKSRQV